MTALPMSPEAASLDAIFDDAAVVELPLRDRPWGRPLLIPSPERAANPLVENPTNRKPRTDGRLPYTRASSLANYITDHSAIDTWQKRSLTYGLAQREDLCARAAALPPIISNTRDKSTLTKQEKLSDELTNKALDEIAEEAMRHANRDYKADWGTAVHAFTDPGPHGAVPERMRADVESWQRKTAGWEFLATEMFTRNERLQSAGTFDHLVRIPWRPDLGAIIVDKKTGILHLDQFSIQGFSYADGEPYNVETDEVYDWPEKPNQDWAILAHIPLGLGRTDLYFVDLRKGRRDALRAIDVRDSRADHDRGVLVDLEEQERMHVAGLLTVTHSADEMRLIAADYAHVWDDSLKAVARQHLAHLKLAS